MQEGFDPGALLARSFALPRGPRVCLRLARIRDRVGVEALLEARGVAAGSVQIATLLRSAPRERVVICATALIDGEERIVGIGATDVDADPAPPLLLVVDELVTEGLAELIAAALESRAVALARDRAA